MADQLIHVVGARPNFVKAAPVYRALKRRGIPQVVVHTGQHYDHQLSAVLFNDLELPDPDFNLGVGSGTQSSQTAAVMTRLEEFLGEHRPTAVLIYGDVNSTLAAALVCSKLLIPAAHVEAGLRSFDNSMPEEINRRVADTLSALHFVTSPEAIANLAREGAALTSIHYVGNTMIDSLNCLLEHGHIDTDLVTQIGVNAARDYGVVTLHRPTNVDDPSAAKHIVRSLSEMAEDYDLIVPLHPRGKNSLLAAGLDRPGIRVMDPLSYIQFISLVRESSFVLTDSGGVQEETTVLMVPCFTLRDNTERPITTTYGSNVLVGSRPTKLRELIREHLGQKAPVRIPPLWDGAAGERIASILESTFFPRSHYLKN